MSAEAVKYTLASDETCKRCGHAGWHWVEPKGPHQKLSCGSCEKYIKFLPKPGNEAKKDPKAWEWAHPARARMRSLPASSAQMDVIERSDWAWYAPYVKHRDEAYVIVKWLIGTNDEHL